MKIKSATLVPYELAFARPLVTASGRYTHRRGWLLRLVEDDGLVGWGDAASWPGFGTDVEELVDELDRMVAGVVGLEVLGLEEIALVAGIYGWACRASRLSESWATAIPRGAIHVTNMGT